MTDDKKIQTGLTPEEYKSVMVSRIEKALREADVPEEQRRDILSFVASDGHLPVSTVPRHSPSRPAAERSDQRTKFHWPAKGTRPVEEPATITDVVRNGIMGGCRTVPELVKLVQKARVSDNKDVRKAVYTALWSLKKDGVIDQGDPPQD